MKRNVLHLVRTADGMGRVPREALCAHEQVGCIDETPPRKLLEQIFAHDITVLW